MYINYKSIDDLNQAVLHNLHRIPHDVDLVVGIPRSGMLPANLLAMYLNKPFTDIDSFLDGKIYGVGERKSFVSSKSTNKIIIIDDSISEGKALKKVKQKLSLTDNSKIQDFTLIFGVVYATDKSKGMVDFYCEIVNGYRLFQWNLFHHGDFIPRSCFDIDGVLCPNPPIDDDGPMYIDYIANAPELYIPSLEIDTLVSCRLEKYRDITEEWLSKHNVRYKHLIMLNLPTREERIRWGNHGKFKGEIYRKSKNVLFVESSLNEAKDIYMVSKKAVFCIETFEMINNESYFNKQSSLLMKSKFYKFLLSFKSRVKKIIKPKS